MDEGKTEWYTATVLSVLRGTDGKDDVTYEVVYDGDSNTPYDIDHLVEDFRAGQVKFIDV